jgi:hypothetical protein
MTSRVCYLSNVFVGRSIATTVSSNTPRKWASCIKGSGGWANCLVALEAPCRDQSSSWVPVFNFSRYLRRGTGSHLGPQLLRYSPSTLYKLRQSLALNYFLILKSYLRSKHFLLKVENECTDLSSVNAGVPQGSVLRPLLYLLCTEDLLTSPEFITATFVDHAPILATDSDPAITSHKLQTNLLAIHNWFKKWRMNANGYKSIHVIFTTRKQTCPSVHISNVQLREEDVNYLGLHLDRRLNWHKHIFIKRKQLGINLIKM